MITYIGLVDKGILCLELNFTDTPNKIKIPKSSITVDGIVNGSIKENVRYIESIRYKYIKDLPKLPELTRYLDTLKEGDIIYCMDNPLKAQVGKLELHLKYNFKKFTGIDVDFIMSLFKEVSRLDKSDKFTEIEIEKYLSSKIDIHPLIETKQLFFYSDMPEGYYYSYNNKETKEKSDDKDCLDLSKTKIVLGKKTSTNVFNVYHISKQEELDKLYNKWRSMNDYDRYAIMLMNRLSSSSNIYYNNSDKLVFKKAPNRLMSPNSDILISEILPAGISYYAFKTFKTLQDILDEFNSDVTDSLVKKSSVDITDLIYDEKYEIKHLSNFDIVYDYTLNDSVYKIVLASGLDLPSRNRLKAIAKFKPRVHLVILNENNVCSRHYTILKYGEESVLTGNYPANLTLL